MEDNKLINDANGDIQQKRIWYNTPDPNFIELCKKSRVAGSWMSYQKVLSGTYGNAPIKPISNYVAKIGHEPSLVSINGNTVRLRFHLYADMFLLKEEGKDLYHIDRTWVRQYYLTNHKMPPRDDCFEETFKFYVPWAIDDNVEVSYLSPDTETPFVIEETKDFWYKVPNNIEEVSPHFVSFMFKKVGKHMEDDELGIPRRGDAMFDMEARVSDIMVERIKEYYGND
jgi:hypothetical protein